MRRSEKLARLGCLVALMSTGAQMGIGGIRRAEGCSGGAPSDGWHDVQVPSSPHHAEIATDGFVALRGALYNQQLDEASLGLFVRVTGGDGAVVPGKLRVLRAATRDEVTQVVLGWQADSALALGSTLHLSWSSDEAEVGAGGVGPVSDMPGVELEVTSQPSSLPVPVVSTGRWLTLWHGVGPVIECTSGDYCGVETLQVPTREERLLGVETIWDVPKIAGMVAWEAWGEPSDAETGVSVPPTYGALTFRFPAREPTGYVGFAEDAKQHCVVVAVKDLRTGEVKRSEPVCAAPEEVAFETTDHRLTECSDLPTPAALDAWCRRRPHDDLICQGSSGAAPDDIDFPTAPGVTQGGAGGAPSYRGNDPSPSTSAAGGGCQMTPPHGSFAFVLAGMCALGALGRRRRRSR